jgi:hypothetical protein
MEQENKAQSTTHQNSSSDIDLSTAEEKVKELSGRVTAAEKAINDLTAKQLEVTLSQLHERAAKIRDLETIYQRLVNALKKRATLEKDEALLREKVKSQEQVGITQEPPYSLSFYDGFLDQLAATEQKKEISRQARKLARFGRNPSPVWSLSGFLVGVTRWVVEAGQVTVLVTKSLYTKFV